MISTGNDIVSLNAINITRTKQYKFYSKILSDSEKPLYNEFGLAGIPFESFVWLLWSIKESAYKSLQRNDPGLIFTPIKFMVEGLYLPSDFVVPGFGTTKSEGTGFDNQTCIKGVVTFGSNTLYSCSLICHEFIFSVVSHDDSFEKTCWGIKLIDNPDHENQSKEVRLFLIEKLQQLYGANDFNIIKSPHNCPILLKGTEESAIPVSLSHHEQFIAYSFQIEG
ncbi:4'-phosphopantetheinyl transferase superfamily protein [Mucilaginibacter sp. OK098]|uniref:4'-phosphopantetheinyl transferase family protein n=1 Tax=Mucilaginibacter sp. OK098 TaxID=1855297 RepID=UPI000917F3D2|nr:4'-phosphopantetheinyl transferase superfamily protein [Mucilaginibacter sp. OK098]SHM28701.1 4'-phosphopantetheinyl transferase superfamily protein [Mucilaginibacter sp. OK098]